MAEQTPRAVAFRPVAEGDFPVMTRWLAEPHVRLFYNKNPITLEEVAAKYGPRVRGEQPTYCHLALSDGRPFGYLQCYRNADWPDWEVEMGVTGGLSIDLYIGAPAFVGGGYGRAMLGGYVREVAFALYPDETRCLIAHAHDNAKALACSLAVGFQPLGVFTEDGIPMRLLFLDRAG